jgi:hypothetical protein
MSRVPHPDIVRAFYRVANQAMVMRTWSRQVLCDRIEAEWLTPRGLLDPDCRLKSANPAVILLQPESRGKVPSHYHLASGGMLARKAVGVSAKMQGWPCPGSIEPERTTGLRDVGGNGC